MLESHTTRRFILLELSVVRIGDLKRRRESRTNKATQDSERGTRPFPTFLNPTHPRSVAWARDHPKVSKRSGPEALAESATGRKTAVGFRHRAPRGTLKLAKAVSSVLPPEGSCERHHFSKPTFETQSRSEMPVRFVSQHTHTHTRSRTMDASWLLLVRGMEALEEREREFAGRARAARSRETRASSIRTGRTTARREDRSRKLARSRMELTKMEEEKTSGALAEKPILCANLPARFNFRDFSVPVVFESGWSRGGFYSRMTPTRSCWEHARLERRRVRSPESGLSVVSRERERESRDPLAGLVERRAPNGAVLPRL